ncbi:MAG TPA: SAM-dependent methyltransferase [Chthoniobacterales bacterium]|nr:SAM-dependent methyltransferase [Chthoniobacterales bacterium]
MQNEHASRTALLIAASLVLLHHDPKHSHLVSKTSSDLCARMLEKYSFKTHSFLKIVQQGWFRPIAKLMEQITIPGMLLHYALRKKSIGEFARAALVDGTTQVVVIGAGFDPLSFELHQEFPGAQFWEIDHPVTQGHKLRTFPQIGGERLHFNAVDFNAATLDREALIKSGFDPAQRTFWIAEGLLMYLPVHIVTSLVHTFKRLSAQGSRFVFTFMEKHSDSRICFHSQSKLVDWWLRRRGEPFLWGSTRDELIHVVRPWRIIRFFDHDDLRQKDSELSDDCIAKGEVICLAEI